MAEKELTYDEPEQGLASQAPIAPGEIVLGQFVDLDSEGRPLVDYPENPTGQPLQAISTVGLTRQHLDRSVALLFAEGDMAKPVIMGLIHSPLFSLIENTSSEPSQASETEAPGAPDSEGSESVIPKVANVDGESVVIEGKKEVVLRCGDASITLTRAGKILIRGKYLLNRSSGVNRILGGSVQVN